MGMGESVEREEKEKNGDLAPLKIMLLGDPQVGKTTIVKQFVEKEEVCDWSLYKPSIGADFVCHSFEVVGKTFTLQIWDTAGCEKFGSLSQSFLKGTEICFLLFDLTNFNTFLALEDLKYVLSYNANSCEHFVVVGTKLDLIESLGRKVDIPVIEHFCQKIGADYFEISVKEKEKVDELFREAILKKDLNFSKMNIKGASGRTSASQEVRNLDF